MKLLDEDILKIEHLNTQNNLFIAQDELATLSNMILENNPNKKWEDIAKNLNSHIVDISNAKTFLMRIYQELIKTSEIKYKIGKNGIDEVLIAVRSHKALIKEIETLKKNIK